MNVPDELRYSKDHEWVASRPERPGSGSASPTTPRTRSATWCSCRCPRSAPRCRPGRASARSSPRSRSPTSTRRVTGTIVEVNDGARRPPGAAQQGPVRRGLALRDRARRPGRARRAARRRRVPGAHRRLSGGDGVTGVFCNHCGHATREGANFCSSCGAPLDVGRRPHARMPPGRPAAGRARTARRRRGRPRPSVGRAPACWSSGPGAHAGQRFTPRRCRSPASAATRTATSSSTTSRCRAATPRSSGWPTAATSSATPARSTAPT